MIERLSTHTAQSPVYSPSLRLLFTVNHSLPGPVIDTRDMACNKMNIVLVLSWSCFLEKETENK